MEFAWTLLIISGLLAFSGLISALVVLIELIEEDKKGPKR